MKKLLNKVEEIAVVIVYRLGIDCEKLTGIWVE